MKKQIYFFRLRFYIVTVVTHTKKRTVSLLKNPFVFVSSILKEGSYFYFLYVSMLAFFLVFVFYLPMYYSLAHHRIAGKLLNKKKLDLCFHAVNAIILLMVFVLWIQLNGRGNEFYLNRSSERYIPVARIVSDICSRYWVILSTH